MKNMNKKMIAALALTSTLVLPLASNASQAPTYEGKDLSYINMHGVEFADGTSFARANLTGTDLSNAKCIKCNFNGANMKLAVIDHSLLSYSYFQKTDMESIRGAFTHCNKCNFKGANLKDADLSFSNLIDPVFTNADLTGVYMTYSKLYRPVMTNSIWDQGNVSMSHLVAVRWTDAKSMIGLRSSGAFLGKR